jgi:hypothetical protein
MFDYKKEILFTEFALATPDPSDNTSDGDDDTGGDG